MNKITTITSSAMTHECAPMLQLWFVEDRDDNHDSRDLMVGAATLHEAIDIWRDRWITNDVPQAVYRVNARTAIRGALSWHGPNCKPVYQAA